MPFKSEKQRRYLWANEPEIARDWTDTYGSRIKKNEGGIMQAGVKNYKTSKMVTVPKDWKSSPDHPDTQLAYITKAEKDLLVKKDLHNSLNGKVNKGPGGVMSLNGWGDKSRSGGRYGDTGGSSREMSSRDLGETQHRNTPEARADRTEYEKNRRARAKDPFHGTIHEGDKKLIKEAKDKEKKFKEIAKIRNIKPTMGHWAQKMAYGVLPNDPTLALQFLSTLKDDDPETWDNLPQELKNLIGAGTFEEADASGMDLYSSWKDHPELSYENWNMLTQVPGYGQYLSDRGKPGVLHSGNVGGLGDRFVKKDKFGNVIKDKFGNTLYGYHEPRGGEGQGGGYMGYPSYAAWLAAQNQGGGGGGITTPATTTQTTSPFQQSLNTGIAQALSPYYVGADPTAANLAWGQQFNVDPRTMYRTTWADGGPIRQRYFLGNLVKKIGRAAKKIVKSPIAKGALLYGLGTGIGSFMPGGTGTGLGRFSYKNLAPLFMRSKAPKDWDVDESGLFEEAPWYKKLSPMKMLGAASLLPFAFQGQGDDKEGKEAFDYDAAKNAYLNEIMKIKRDAMAGTLDPSQFVYQGVKDGGRIGYAEGGDGGSFDINKYYEDEYNKYIKDIKLGLNEFADTPMSFSSFVKMLREDRAQGGRIGYQGGGMEDPLLVDEYKKYIFEMEEMGLQPMSFEEFKAQAIAGMASGGRAGYYKGGQSIPSENTMIDASKTAMQDRLGGITDVMKTADLYRQGDIGQMYMAEGGEIGSRNRLSELMVKLANGTITLEEKIELMHLEKDSTSNKAQGGRIGADEGGIMDLGGVEKDYRETGGFVPIGKEEKADDVPARLSLNEFVMTADAVRGMGDGDIDQGAERMEDLMETLEVKGKKNQGAQDMFEVSERLSAVV